MGNCCIAQGTQLYDDLEEWDAEIGELQEGEGICMHIADSVRCTAETHYHPDHMGLIPELMRQGVKLLLLDTQRESVHFSDYIFARDGLPFEPIDEIRATVIRCEESRQFFSRIGINGEVIATPSHSPDSISLLLDSGDAFVGDLQPYEYLDGYDGDDAAKADWTRIHGFQTKRIFYAHAN